MSESYSLVRAWTYTVLISFGGILYGIDQGGLSGFLAMAEYNKKFGTYKPATKAYAITADWQLALNMVTLGAAVFASIVAGEITSRFGRRAGMSALGVAGTIGGVIQLAAPNISVLLVAKIFIGMTFGFTSMGTSLFIGEIAPKNLRASMISFLLLTFSLGAMIGSGINWASHSIASAWAYRGPFIANLIPPIVVGVGAWFVPESPRWLVMKGRIDSAAHSLRKLRGSRYPQSAVEQEVHDIVVAVEEERKLSSSNVSWIQLFQGTNRRRTVIGILLFFFNQYSGISFVTSYGTYFFSISGITDPFLIGFLLFILAGAGCVFAIVVTPYVGRRKMMLTGGVVQFISMITLSIVGVAASGTTAAAHVLVAFVLIYEFATHASWGPLCYVIAGEVASNELRSKTVALAVGTNWAMTMTVAGWLPYALNPSYGNLGAKVGFIFGPVIAIGTIWMYFALPETANRTLEDIDEMFVNGISARRSASFVGSRQLETEKPETMHEEEYKSPL